MSRSRPKSCPACGYSFGGDVEGDPAEQFSSSHLDRRAQPSDDSEGDREFANAIRDRKRNRWVR